MIGLTLFTKSNLAEFRSPVAPDPVSDTSSHSNGDNDSEEDANTRGAVLLVELLFMPWTRVGRADFE